MSPAKKEISLLPDSENSNTFSARAVRWVSNVARVVIILTELIVIGAFLSRFWLDRRNSDLSDTLRQQRAILKSSQNFENDYNLLQKKLTVIRQYYNNQPVFQPKIDTLTTSTPPEITYSSLQFKNTDGQISAILMLNAYQESSIIDFITNLILNPKIKSVDVNTIEKKPKDAKYIVNLSVSFIPDVTN